MKAEDEHIESAIIGMWRSGATPGEIAHAVNGSIERVKEIIELYYFENKINLKKDEAHRR